MQTADAIWYPVGGNGQNALDRLKRLPEEARGREAYGVAMPECFLPGPGGIVRLESGRPIRSFCIMRKFPGFTLAIKHLGVNPEFGTIDINRLMLLHVQQDKSVLGFFRPGVEETLANSREAAEERAAQEEGIKTLTNKYQLRVVLEKIDKAVQNGDIAPNTTIDEELVALYCPDGLPSVDYPAEPWQIADLEEHNRNFQKGVNRGPQ